MKIKDKLAKLIDVKSIMTLVLTGVFAYLATVGKINAEQFLVIYSTCAAFYFGTKINDKSNNKKE